MVVGRSISRRSDPTSTSNLTKLPKFPSGAASSYILSINRLVAASPAFLVLVISALLSIHASEPFIICSRTVTTSAYKGSTSHDVHSLVLVPEATYTVRIDPAGQLFDPRNSYILVGGCSELGVRITEWMVNHGARHVFLTSRRGPRGLTKIDNMYVRSMRSTGVQAEVIAANAINKVEAAAVVARAKEVGPIGGIFVMTVVLRDAKFTNLTQQPFDEVYQSKVAVLDTPQLHWPCDDRLHAFILDYWIRVQYCQYSCVLCLAAVSTPIELTSTMC